MKVKFPQVMKSITAISCLATVIFAALYRVYSAEWLLSSAITCGTTCYHFSMRLLVGALVPPVKGVSAWFRPKKWEPTAYRLLGVKSWKQHLPTYNPHLFSLNENTLDQVIRNMCGAEVVHEVIMVCSFLPLFAIPVFGAGAVFGVTSLLAALFDSLFVIAQRYNRPRLERIRKKQEAYTP